MKQIQEKHIETLLQKVERPGRYAGGEFGIPDKNVESVRASAVFAFPDLYEIGMSNQGWKILYDRVNRCDDFLADRVFLPADDFASELKSDGLSLFSLDHRFEISSFDLLGINVSHELSYTNILYLLELSGIPLLNEDRGEDMPIVIAGGTAVTNPLPISGFLDAFFLGDGEDAILEIMNIIATMRGKGEKRKRILEELRNVTGILLSEDIPAMRRGDRPPVKRRTYRSSVYGDLKFPVVPGPEITQDRVVVETSRGCGRGCRFCHAGFWKRPLRNADPDEIIRVAGEMLKKTGSDSISLHSLTLADYPFLEEVVNGLVEKYGHKGISLSLPSLRVDERTIPILEATSGIRKSGVTFAIEAGSEYLRRRIRKAATEEELLDLIREVFSRGWDLAKIYFMVGLPDDSDSEVDELVRALHELNRVAVECGPSKRLNVSISLFVPKPHTTFQWAPLNDPDFFYDAIERLKSEFRKSRIQLKYPDPWMSYVEGILSRADEKGGDVILEAYRKGARFDSWDDRFDRDLWKELIFSLGREIIEEWTGEKRDAPDMPWEKCIEADERRFFRVDHQKMIKVSRNTVPIEKSEKPTRERIPVKRAEMPEHMFHTKHFMLLEYERKKPSIYLGHLDAMEAVRKSLRRAEIPMAYSFGFNKHEKLHFFTPLPLYFFSESERVVVELYDSIDIQSALKKISNSMPIGMDPLSIQLLDSLPAMNEGANCYRLDFNSTEEFERAKNLLEHAPEEFSFMKKAKRKKGKGKRRAKELKEVTKRLAKAVNINSVNTEWRSIALGIDDPDSGAISVTDLLTNYLNYPPEQWNVVLRITRVSSRSVSCR